MRILLFPLLGFLGAVLAYLLFAPIRVEMAPEMPMTESDLAS